MDAKEKEKERKSQEDFCFELAKRLHAFDGPFTQKKDDIKRLRRELTKLSHMYDWDWRFK
jgi:hypothetical protein